MLTRTQNVTLFVTGLAWSGFDICAACPSCMSMHLMETASTAEPCTQRRMDEGSTTGHQWALGHN